MPYEKIKHVEDVVENGGVVRVVSPVNRDHYDADIGACSIIPLPSPVEAIKQLDFFKQNILRKLIEMNDRFQIIINGKTVHCKGKLMLDNLYMWFDFDYESIPEKLVDRLQGGKLNLTTENYYGRPFERPLREISIAFCSEINECMYHSVLKSGNVVSGQKEIVIGETLYPITKMELSPRQIDLFESANQKFGMLKPKVNLLHSEMDKLDDDLDIHMEFTNEEGESDSDDEKSYGSYYPAEYEKKFKDFVTNNDAKQSSNLSKKLVPDIVFV